MALCVPPLPILELRIIVIHALGCFWQNPSMAIGKSRLSRIKTLGGLATKLASGAVASVGDRLTLGREAANAKLHRATAEHLLETLGGMKGLPMKVGQILSFMDGVVPAKYVPIYRAILAQLQVKAQPLDWDQMKTIFEKEFGVSPESIFNKFDKTPIAAASIGQVYKAELKDGRLVVVKVQYPEISEAVESDLKNVEGILKTFRAVIPSFDNRQMAGDFLNRFREELDYRLEAKNQQVFYEAWQSYPKVIIPAPVIELCRHRVLISDWHSGKSFGEVLSSADAATKSAYGETLFWFTFHSLFSFGIFNADPHPGNYLFQEDGRVVFLDFGSVQRYDEESRGALRTLVRAILSDTKREELWAVLETTLLIAPGTSENVKNAFLEYLFVVLEPILAEQPYRFTAEFTSQVASLSAELKLNMAKSLLQTKWREPKREGLSPLVRILFGLNTVLAGLEAESDWRTLISKA